MLELHLSEILFRNSHLKVLSFSASRRQITPELTLYLKQYLCFDARCRLVDITYLIDHQVLFLLPVKRSVYFSSPRFKTGIRDLLCGRLMSEIEDSCLLWLSFREWGSNTLNFCTFPISCRSLNQVIFIEIWLLHWTRFIFKKLPSRNFLSFFAVRSVLASSP